MIPLSGPSAAAFMAALISSLVTSALNEGGQVGDAAVGHRDAQREAGRACR